MNYLKYGSSLLGSAALLVACGGTATNGADSEAGGDGDTGSTGDGDAMDDSAASGGNPGDGDRGDEPLANCQGEFGVAEVLLEGGHPTSPSLTSDRLRLLYVDGASGSELFYESVRTDTTTAFGAGTPLTELNELCPPPLDKNLDVSEDGLRLYFTCYESFTAEESLRFASRSDLSSPFVYNADVGVMASGASLSSDELTVTSALPVAGLATNQAQRSSRSEEFAPSTPILGLEDTNLFAPVVSPDGLEIYGGLSGESVVARSRRDTPAGKFLAPVPLDDMHPPGVNVSGAPELSTDCRSLVFVGVDQNTVFRLYEATR